MLNIENLVKSVTAEAISKDGLNKFAGEIEERLNNMKNKEEEIYTIDRIEGNIAVCENRNTKEIINIEKNKLPEGLAEGNILRYKEGKFIIDKDLQNEIEKRIKDKMDKLWDN